jgi:hypothetical protein
VGRPPARRVGIWSLSVGIWSSQTARSTSRRGYSVLPVGGREAPRGYLVPGARATGCGRVGLLGNTSECGYPVLSDVEVLDPHLDGAGFLERGYLVLPPAQGSRVESQAARGYLVLKRACLSDSLPSDGRGRSTHLWKTRRPSVVAFRQFVDQLPERATGITTGGLARSS